MKQIVLISILVIYFSTSNAQNWGWTMEEVANMPTPISNNAVVEGWANDTPYVYSFAGIDTTKIWSGISLKSFRYNTVTDQWDTIPPLPDTMGKIAAAASYVDSIIYIIGGYHVFSNGNETSSNKVHRYDPRTNSYLSDGAIIPVPIDDHVQAVWNDSLIYVITGWSNTTNVPNVQIYNPSTNTWLTGTPTPNNYSYKVFGASGTIVGNTIYYHGGSTPGFNFPAQSKLRIGEIDPNDPTQITWSFSTTPFLSYRSCSLNDKVWNFPHFIGGSDVSYNYNGIAYDGSGGVSPNTRAIYYDGINVDTATFIAGQNLLPMDLRGAAAFPNHSFYTEGVWYLAGGMEQNQKVSKKAFKLIYTLPVSNQEIESKSWISIYPNPSSETINLKFKNQESKSISLVNIFGKEISKIQSNNLNVSIDVSTISKGIYFVTIESIDNHIVQKIVVQ